MKKINTDILKNKISEIAAYDLDNNNVYGSSYFVYQNGDVIYKNHFGTVSASGGEVSDTTVYRLASMTKPVTAVAILILTDRGLVDLNDPVKKYIPEFGDIHVITADGEDLGTTKTDVTILHLLTHTSGFGSFKAVNPGAEDKKTIESTIKYFMGLGLDYEPFTRNAYSAYAAFDVAAMIVEKVTGEDFADFIRKEIFEPCDMTDTTFAPSREQWQRMMTMHGKEDGKSVDGKVWEGMIFEDFPCEHKLAGAGLVSTLSDYSKFAVMLLSGGKHGDRRVLSEDAMKLMSTPHVPKEIILAVMEYGLASSCQSWGLGVRVITEDTYDTLPVGAFGWSGAYGSHFWIDPENKIAAVYLKNSRFDGGAGNKSAVRFEKAVTDSLE